MHIEKIDQFWVEAKSEEEIKKTFSGIHKIEQIGSGRDANYYIVSAKRPMDMEFIRRIYNS